MDPTEALAGKLTERWSAAIVGPAFAFWVGSLAAWAWGNGGLPALERLDNWFTHRSSAVQALAVAGTLLGIAATGNAVRAASGPLIRILEGYWPTWIGPIRRTLVSLQAWRYKRLHAAWNDLEPSVRSGTAPEPERSAKLERFARLDARLRRYPPQPHPDEPAGLMPTQLGNVLNAAETRPRIRYGLDPVAIWPQLWLVLPADAKQDLAEARGKLDAAASACLWSVLFVILTYWAWWASVLGVASAIISYLSMVAAAKTYADLLESSFDMYRADLYRQLRWPLPQSPADEREKGEALTRYLWRGSDQASPQFTREGAPDDRAGAPAGTAVSHGQQPAPAAGDSQPVTGA